MLVKTLEQLPNFDDAQPLCIDIETTSFDDNKKGLYPFQGTRSCGYAIGTLDGKNSWYLPIRHREGNNLPLKGALQYLRNVIGSGRDIVNHNIKFDACVWHQDGCESKGALIDTQTMARLWKSDLYRYSLDALTGGNKDKRVKDYLKKRKSKDYGIVPIEIMAPYAENDVIITSGLYQSLKKKLRPEVSQVLATENALAKKLVDAQIYGVKVDWDLLMHTYKKMLHAMLELEDKMNKLAGYSVDYGKVAAVDHLLIEEFGIEPISFTDTGKPQWDGKTLDCIKHPIAPLLKEYNHLFHFSNTYCKGWMERRGDDDRLHPNFKQYGTKTGRLSAVDPNFQNITAEAEMFVLPDEDHVILGGDYSQIEYRLFAHYAQDANILEAYNKNRDADYHQALAEMLGVDRQFAKSLNFAFLYGMGKKKLLSMIAGIVAINSSDENMQAKMRTFLTGGGASSAAAAEKMDLEQFKDIANNIFDTYHEKVPSVKILKHRVEKAIKIRGWLKNYCGRIYTIPAQACYKGVNLLIQGSAADIFKERLLECLDTLPDLKLISNVHDSVFFSCHRDVVEERALKFQEVMEKVEGVRVPLRFELKASEKCWGTCVSCKDPKDIKVTLSESLKKSGRVWGKSA